MSIVDEIATILGMLTSSLITSLTYPISLSFQVAFTASLLGLITTFLVKTPSSEKPEPTKEAKISLKQYTGYLKFIIPLTVFSLIAIRAEILFQAIFETAATSLSLLGIIYMFAKIFSILGSWLAHKIESKLGTIKSINYTILLQIFSAISLFTLNQYFAIAALAIFFFAENIFRNIRDSFILKLAPSHLKSTALSIVSFSSAILLLLFTLILGITLDFSIYLAIAVFMGIKIISLGFFLFKKFPQHSPSTKQQI